MPVNDFTIKISDYKNFNNFLENRFDGEKEYINPLNFFLLKKGLVDQEFLSDDYLSIFFTGRKINLPFFNILDKEFQKYSSFEEYTAINEVDNISMWILSAIDYFVKIINCDNYKLGKEIEIYQSEKPRDGRLDVVAQIEENILFFESKISLKSALSENRFIYQIPSYYNEGVKYIKKSKQSFCLNGFLILGGDESDIFPPTHPDCISGLVGDASKIFYDKLNKNGIKFISANFLWSLVNYSYVKGVKIDLFGLIKKESNKKDFIGFLSGGVVIKGKVNSINISDYILS